MIFNLTSPRGDTLTQFFTVYNKEEIARSFRVYKRDWTFTEKGHVLELEPGSHPRGCAGWLKVTPQNFTIDAKSSQTVRFTMIVPNTSKSGSYWGDIYVEPAEKPKLASKVESEGRSLTIFLKIRAKISINVTVEGDLKRAGEITNVEVTPGTEETPITVHTTFRNTSNLILRCKGRVELRDERGETVETLGLGGFKVYPDGERTIKTQIKNALNHGEYSVLSVVDFDGDYLVAGEAEFEIEKQLLSGETARRAEK